MSRVILPRALKSVPLEDDKALFLWKKRELFEFSGTSRSSSVCKFNESVEATVLKSVPLEDDKALFLWKKKKRAV